MSRAILRARGQTLLLFALTALLLCLMVMMTLSIGSRIRDRTELQIAADAAAYSQAVATARTFNHVALLNRTLIGALSTHTAMQSLVSWSGHHLSTLDGLIEALTRARDRYDGCRPRRAGGCRWEGVRVNAACAAAEREAIDRALTLLEAERRRIRAGWDALDGAAGDRAREQYRWFSTVTAMNLRMYTGRDKPTLPVVVGHSLQEQLANQQLTRRLIEAVNPELTAPQLADPDNKSWLEVDLGSGDGAGVWPAGGSKEAMMAAVMGTRGHAFTTARRNGRELIKARLESFLHEVNPRATVELSDSGGSGFGSDPEGALTFTGLGDQASWAHDHGGPLVVTWPPLSAGCAAVPAADRTARVATSWIQMIDRSAVGEHRFGGADSQPADVRHGFDRCVSNCPRMWPAFVDYRFSRVGEARDNFGMPKLYAIIRRDYAARAWRDPWDLFARFRFSAAKAARTLDTRPGSGVLTDQVGIASGMAYYHRPDAWREPPNFYNPFWRATLTEPDDDLERRLSSAGLANHAAVVGQLKASGLEVAR